MAPTLRLLLVLVSTLMACSPAMAAEPALRAISPDPATCTSAAIVVGENASLVHTPQILPLNADGTIIGPDRAEDQANAILERLDATLRAARSGLDRLVKVHVYARRPEATVVFKEALARRLAGQSVSGTAFSAVVGALPHPEALLALDAVAVSSSTRRGGGGVGAVERVSVPALAGQGTGMRVAILPSGPRVYISGQAEPGPDLAQATRRTLEKLGGTLAWLGLDRGRVVQVKAFLAPMRLAGDVEREVAAFFGVDEAPPLTLVEWISNQPIEIELVAAARPSGPGIPDHAHIAYLTPPDLKPSPVFSRVVRISRGALIYVSDLHGVAATSASAQVEAIFDRLGGLLRQAGGHFHSLAKATYYVSDDAASRALNELRPRYYDASTPPAASKATVTAVGVEECTVSLDMIAVVQSEP